MHEATNSIIAMSLPQIQLLHMGAEICSAVQKTITALHSCLTALHCAAPKQSTFDEFPTLTAQSESILSSYYVVVKMMDQQNQPAAQLTCNW